MIENRITAEQAAAFADHLRAEERSPGTICAMYGPLRPGWMAPQ